MKWNFDVGENNGKCWYLKSAFSGVCENKGSVKYSQHWTALMNSKRLEFCQMRDRN